MASPPEPTPETANAQKKTTSPKKITDQQIWEEIGKLNTQINILSQMVTASGQDSSRTLSELHAKQDSQQKLIEDEFAKIRTEIDRINTKMITVNSNILGIRNQLTTIGDKADQSNSQSKEPIEQTGKKPAKKWWEFWKR